MKLSKAQMRVLERLNEHGLVEFYRTKSIQAYPNCRLSAKGRLLAGFAFMKGKEPTP